MKAYIVNDSRSGYDNIEGCYYLILETGELLYSHWCSNKYFAIGDLYRNRKERVEECILRFDDFEVIYLGSDEMTKDKLLLANKTYYSNNEVNNV